MLLPRRETRRVILMRGANVSDLPGIHLLKRTLTLFGLFGFDPLRFVRALRGLPRFLRDLRSYRSADVHRRLPVRLVDLEPRLSDRFENAGVASGHYFHQDLWAARKIFLARPAHHLDVGSRVDGFIAHLLTFMPVEVIDIRPLKSSVVGLSFTQDDAGALARIPDGSVTSISSLHAVEHFGLGRYGDPVDPQAPFQAMRALERVLAPGGTLYFSVPIGIERVCFTAHRIFSPRTILGEFSALRLVSFSAVGDAGELDPDCPPDRYAQARYACGLFEFTKVAS